jgi:hypothetical protein
VPIDPRERETLTLEEHAISSMFEIEALINLLERKGVLTRNEVLEEIKKLSEEK